MTVDDRGGPPAGDPPPVPPRRSTRDLERYAALFASRTKVMKSSAMRDLMAITERPEVISLAGGLPDTSTFPAESLAALTSKMAAVGAARALQYAPTEGMAAAKACVAEVMAHEGTPVDPEDVLVTTGGQQVIDLVCKTLVDPGDVVVAEAPPTLHSLDRGEFVIYLGTFSKILSPGIRLGWTMAPAPVLEKMNLGKQGADLCSSAFSQMFVASYFDHDRWLDYLESLKDLYRRRRDTMLDALAEHFRHEAAWTRPQGGLFIWATLPDYIDTTDLLARALSHNVAFVPGRAAYLDGRGGSSMRLNFSGVSEHDIREGIRRIGEVVREQVGLYGTLTGAAPPAAAEPEPAPAPGPDL